MTMTWLFAAAITGLALGLLYFGGLWLTVRRMTTAQSPALLFLASFLARAAVVVVGFHLVMNGRWESAMMCLAGLLLARTVVVRRVRRAERHSDDTATSLSEVAS